MWEGDKLVTALWFGILGPLEVRAGDQPVPLRGARTERVLAALLLDADRVVTIEHLVDAVWPQPPATAQHQVRDLVTRLRRALVGAGAEPAVVCTTRAGYALHLGDAGFDVRTFEGLVNVAPGADAPAVVDRLRRALALWRGEPLAGVRGPLFEDAARVWHERHLAVRERCLELELSLGRHRALIPELVALVAAQPFHESMVGLLMRALDAAGRRVEALDAFVLLQKRLADELGVSPAADLQRLYGEILRGEPNGEHQGQRP